MFGDDNKLCIKIKLYIYIYTHTWDKTSKIG